MGTPRLSNYENVLAALKTAPLRRSSPKSCVKLLNFTAQPEDLAKKNVCGLKGRRDFPAVVFLAMAKSSRLCGTQMRI